MNNLRQKAFLRNQKGVGLIETMIAAVILLIGVMPVMALFVVAVAQNKAQGDYGTQVTTFAQDKLEQLRSLPNFNDPGLCGAMAANVTCGSVDPANPQTGYVDYLSSTGVVVGGASQATFTRQWQINTDATGRIKTIIVQTTAPTVANQTAPKTILTTFKSKDGF